MFRLLAMIVLGLVSTAVLFGSPSPSVVVPLKEKCSGTVLQVAPGHLSFAGIGQASYFGKYSMVGSSDFDNLGNLFNGQFVSTLSDGSTIEGVLSGTYTPLPTGQIRFDVAVTFLNGTGRLVGVTGQADVVAVLDGVAPGAAFEYEGIGNLLVP
jgi:hypothetical protein